MKSKYTKVIFYWDYDGEFGGERSWDNPRKGVGYEDYYGTKKILDILDEFNLKAVFAFVGAVANAGPLPYFAPDVVREVHERGHEVASHGWQHEWIPSLSKIRLKKILEWSKKTLEDASGGGVVSFVPPWNAPTRYIRKTSLGLYEFRRTVNNRIDIPLLCETLREVGFKTTRSTYEPFFWTLLRWLTKGKKRKRFFESFKVKGILLVPPNTPGGFGESTIKVLDKAVKEQKELCVFWAHPHSLLNSGKQSAASLVKLLRKVKDYVEAGKVKVVLAKDLVNEEREK